MAPMKLPPGFRFHPTDIELVTYYLKRKVHGRAIEFDIVAEVDIYKCEPWDLPDKSLIGSSDPEWYFFSARDKKYANGSRTNRATEAGYWKATGKDRTVKTGSHTVGMKKTLVFYKGRAPHGERTDWVMHEYRLEDDESGKAKLQDAFVLCRVFKKNGIGPNHPENATSLDFEDEIGGTTTEDISVPDEKSLVSTLSIDASASERDSNHSEMKDNRGALDDNLINEAPFNSITPEASDNDMSMFYASLLNDPNQLLENFNTIKESTSELESLVTLMKTEGPVSPITAQDCALWLEIPTSLGDLSESAAFSGNQLGDLSEYYSPEEADMLDELYHSTQQSQGFQLADQHAGASSSIIKYAVQTPTLSSTVSEDIYDISEVEDDRFKDELSTLSEQRFFEEGQASTAKPVTGSEDDFEEEMLEELFQLINQTQEEGQRSHEVVQQSQGGVATSGVDDDVFFDILQESNTDEWMQTVSWNEASAGYDNMNDSLEPTNDHLEDWLSETLASPSDLPSFSESLPELSGSGVLVDLTTSATVHMSSLQDSSSKPSKLLSHFSKLLDSVPVLPASAAEFPPHVEKQVSESKDDSFSNPGKAHSSIQATASNVSFSAVTVRCSFEFMFGVLKSSTRSKQKTSMLEESSVASLNTPIDDMPLSKDSSEVCNLRRGNGCYPLVFFLGALSAVCWFLLLRIAWRVASYMGSLLI